MGDALKDDLKQQIENKQCIVVVGAGVSIFSTGCAPCATWQGLLKHGIQRCADIKSDLSSNWVADANTKIASGKVLALLSVAEMVSGNLHTPAMGSGEYARWLRESIGELRVEHREVLEALRDLNVVIATTNYDHLIETVTGLPPVTWQDGARMQRVLRGDERAVLHLHGHWQQPDTVILGTRSYKEVLRSAHAKAMQQVMASMRTMLFIGCGDGLTDPNIGGLLRWAGRVFANSEYRHYRLARFSEQAELQKEGPNRQRLFVLPYGNDFNDLAPYLRSLKPVAVAVCALPPKPSCFGRDKEVRGLIEALVLKQPAPVPVLGPPGIGKTNLALTAAHSERVTQYFGSRRFFVRCDGQASGTDLAGAIAASLGLVLSPDNESAVLVELGKGPALLILDNTETPWEADLLGVEELLGRLAGVPSLALLVTLRGNERPAGVPWGTAFRPEPITPCASRDLFNSLSEHKFDHDTLLNRLLSALDHVPLAITLVAALAEGEPNLASIWQRWNEVHTAMLLRAKGEDRLTNMEHSYALSWTAPRMTPEARRLLQLLALLPAGLAHTHLERVLPQGHVVASTLRKTGLAFDEADRLRVLAPLREYVQACYPPITHDLQHMIRHFISLATQYGQLLGKNQSGSVLKRLSADALNIEAMMLLGLKDSALTDLVIKAAPSWADCVRFSGVGSPAPFEGAAKAAKLAGDLLGQARCTLGLGNIARARADNDQAQLWYEGALTLFRQADCRFGQANCIFSLGEITRLCGNHRQAQEHYEQAQPLYLEVDDYLGVANCTLGMGDAAFASMDYPTAQTRYEEAHKLYCQEHELYSQANCINRLGDVATKLGKYELAQARYEEALSLFRQEDHIVYQGFCHFRIARLYLTLRREPEALERFRDALDCYEKCGHPYPVGAAHYFWALVCDEKQQDAHRQQARNIWSRLDRKELLGLAVADGLQATEIERLMQVSP